MKIIPKMAQIFRNIRKNSCSRLLQFIIALYLLFDKITIGSSTRPLPPFIPAKRVINDMESLLNEWKNILILKKYTKHDQHLSQIGNSLNMINNIPHSKMAKLVKADKVDSEQTPILLPVTKSMNKSKFPIWKDRKTSADKDSKTSTGINNAKEFLDQNLYETTNNKEKDMKFKAIEHNAEIPEKKTGVFLCQSWGPNCSPGGHRSVRIIASQPKLKGKTSLLQKC